MFMMILSRHDGKEWCHSDFELCMSTEYRMRCYEKHRGSVVDKTVIGSNITWSTTCSSSSSSSSGNFHINYLVVCQFTRLSDKHRAVKLIINHLGAVTRNGAARWTIKRWLHDRYDCHKWFIKHNLDLVAVRFSRARGLQLAAEMFNSLGWSIAGQLSMKVRL